MLPVGLIALIAANATGMTCAAIDNGPNTAAWAVPSGRVVTSHYSDRGDRLIYRPAPGPRQNRAWIALHNAEASLGVGAPGRKVRLACT